jgi:hypothetical protein
VQEAKGVGVQDLLDLLPQPMCGNCEQHEAAMECADCREYYCTPCWEAVHYGGKRALHNFRALYDYYSKRIDYGDSEFPSKWPSEIEQVRHCFLNPRKAC